MAPRAEQVYHKNIKSASKLLLGLFSFNTTTSESTMNFEWLKKKKKVYITVLYILKCIYRKEYTCKVCVSALFQKEEALFQKFHLLVLRLTRKKRTPGRSRESNHGFPQQRPSRAFEAKSMKVAVEKIKDSNFSDSVTTALGEGPILVCPLFTSYSETPTSLSQSAVQGIFHAPLVVFLSISHSTLKSHI